MSKYLADQLASELTRKDDDGWTYGVRFYFGSWHIFAWDEEGFELGPISI